MDDDNHHNDLPPFPSAAVSTAGILLSPLPPNSGHLPILPQPPPPPPLGLFSPTPQSFFFTNNNPNPFLYEQIPSHFPPPFIPYGYPVEPKDEGRRVLDAWNTKVARSKRRLARQRTLSLGKTNSSSSSSSGLDEHSKPTTVTHYPNTTDSQSNKSTQNLFTFCTPDKKVLRILLKKDLKNSDVGSLGRIVLPKREAEENLPLLTDKEGMQIVMRDVNSDRKWAMKYKYWVNNRSRMYVLENTGEFVKQNRLLMGDTMTLYEDEDNNVYVNVEKGENHPSVEENYEMRNNNNQHSATVAAGYTTMNIKDEEEEASLALLIEELKHKTEEDDPPPCCCNNNNNNNNNLVVSDPYFERGISSGSYTSNTRRAAAASSSASSNIMGASKGSYNHQGKEVEDDLQAMNNGFEDCFGGLDTLPEVSGFNFHPFDYLNNDRT